MAPSAATVQAYPLLDLPAELRNRIYELVLVRRYSISIGTSKPTARPDERKAIKTPSSDLAPPALTRTSKKLRGEALPVFYGCNIFEIFIHGRRDLPIMQANAAFQQA